MHEHLSNSSRVWIYQSNRSFREEELAQLNLDLSNFAVSWTAHSQQLKAIGKVFYDRFIVLMVDESQAGASGCSIDKSVHFIRALENKYGVNLFDRMTFAIKEGESIKTAHRDTFSKWYQEGKINDETLVFDNLVKTKGDLDSNWIKPLGESWHKRIV